MELIAVEDFRPPKKKMDAHKQRMLQHVGDIIHYFVWGFFVLGLFIQLFNDPENLLVPLIAGSVLITFYLIYRLVMPDRWFTPFAIAVILFLFLIIFESQTGGAWYVRIVFFLTAVILILYQDWRVVTTYFALSDLFYLLIFLLSVYSEETLQALLPRAAEITATATTLYLMLNVAHYGVCFFLSTYLKEQSDKEARNAIYLEDQLNIQANTDLANQIAQGNLDGEYALKENDIMGSALLQMKENLKKIREEERIQRWINTGVARVSDLLLNSSEVNVLAERVLNELVTYLNAHQGSVYVLNDEQEDAERHYLEPKSSYAFAEADFFETKIEMGEGLIGEAALRKMTVHIQDAPQGFVKISSGMGDSSPTSVLIVPLKVKENVLGVVEIASFNTFAEYEVEFLEKVSESIAVTLLSSKSSSRKNTMLAEYQLMNEQMKAQEEEMRLNMEELQSTQEKLSSQMSENDRIQEELTLRSDALNEIAIVVETDESGRITYVSDKFVETAGIARLTLQGRPLSSTWHEEDRDRYYEIESSVRRGETTNALIRYQTSDEQTFWVESTIRPIFNEYQALRKIIVIGFDVTERVRQQEYVKTLLKEMERKGKTAGMLEALDGDAEGRSGTLIDADAVAERQRAEERLEAQQRAFEDIIEAFEETQKRERSLMERVMRLERELADKEGKRPPSA